MTHTKGKWSVRGNKIFIDDTYRSVATVHVVKNYKDITFEPIEDAEAIANAKLIADAPNLLAVLNKIVNSPTPYNEMELQIWYETARNLALDAVAQHLPIALCGFMQVELNRTKF
jgi:hypothetical protein